MVAFFLNNKKKHFRLKNRTKDSISFQRKMYSMRQVVVMTDTIRPSQAESETDDTGMNDKAKQMAAPHVLNPNTTNLLANELRNKWHVKREQNKEEQNKNLSLLGQERTA
jgi:hypothetical protein